MKLTPGKCAQEFSFDHITDSDHMNIFLGIPLSVAAIIKPLFLSLFSIKYGFSKPHLTTFPNHS